MNENANASNAGEASGFSVKVGDDIEIRADRPLPKYDNGPVKAYAALGSGQKPARMFCLVCERHLPPRDGAVSIYASFNNLGIARFITKDVVFWPIDRTRRYVLLYEDTLGDPVVPRGEPLALGWRTEDVDKILKHMYQALVDFQNKDFVHSEIRMDNLFRGASGDPEYLVFGDSLSLPFSYAQSVLYEPVERSMAQPAGRGIGSFTEDMYAFGVCLAIMLRHHDPMAGMTPEEMIKHKVEFGSYTALTVRDRISGPILELLRGLLFDDAEHRWTLEDVQAWLDGRRLSPKQNVKKLKAARPLSFNGEKYLRPHILAMDLHKNVSEIVQMVENGGFEQWVKRSLESKDMEELLEKAVENAKALGTGNGYWDRLVSRLCSILDSEGPIRYKGLVVHPDGYGAALAEAVALGRDISVFADLIEQQCIMFWLEVHKGGRADINSLIGKIDSCRAFLRQKNAGYGIERALYFLNPDVSCLSEKLKDYYVRAPEDLMFAFEDMCASGNAPVRFLDRHIIAFLSIKERRVVDPHLVDLNSSDEHARILGTLRTLAGLQSRMKLPPCPYTAKHLFGMFDPVFKRFHDRLVRDEVRGRLEKLSQAGDIVKMSAIIESPEFWKRDMNDFRAAQREYTSLRQEKRILESRVADRRTFGRGTGREVAALVSGVLAGIVIVGIALMGFSGNSLF